MIGPKLDRLVQGSIDMHVHCGPDYPLERRFDALQTAMQAQQMGMGSIVLKSHFYPTAALAQLAGKSVPGLALFGSHCVNLEAGGLNAFSVETSARLGAKVVWMPTLSSSNCRAKVARSLGIDVKGEGISILSSEGELLTQVKDILHVVKAFKMVLATGHISPEETFVLVSEAERMGISNIVITHPLGRGAYEAWLGLDELRQLANRGAFIEHCFYTLMPTGSKHDPAETVELTRAVGAEHCIMSTDFGQAPNPAAPEGMRMFIATMLKHGLSEEEIELMVKVNPSRLLGLI